MSSVEVVGLEFYDAGMCVLPAARDGSKRPDVSWQEYQHRRATREQVALWLRDAEGFGVVCGAVSGGLEMIELEARAAHLFPSISEAAELAGLSAAWDRISNGYFEMTPSGGVHLLFRCPDEPLRNTKLARNSDGEVLIETRGEGGWTVLAPSHGRTHSTGQPWVRLDGDATTIAVLTAEERDALHQLMRTFDAVPDRPDQQTAGSSFASATVNATRPGDDYNTHAVWEDILGPLGATKSYTRDGTTHWTRPGKESGGSATTGHSADGVDRLYVFSTSWPPFDAETPYSKFAAYTLLSHNGDFAAAARQLSADGYGTDRDSVSFEDDAAPTSSRFRALDWPTLWSDESSQEWIAEPILPAGRTVTLYAPAKLGKSLLVLDMVAAIATGRPFLGRVPDRPRRVLYLDFENDPKDDVRTRLQDMGYSPDDLASLVFLSFPDVAPFDTATGGDDMMAAVQMHRPEVVVVDTVSRTISGGENENDTWLNFYRHTGKRLKAAGIALVRIDHSGKDETRGQRGGSAKSGDIDAVWRMSEVVKDEVFRLTCEASRMRVSEKTVTIRRCDDPLRHEYVADGDRAGRAHQIVATLDRLGVPVSAGQPTARLALRANGIRVNNADLAQAVRTRKTLPQGTLVGIAPEPA
jgi:AAA domain/Bifunctional DNA primase/polymerase, N-terminal